MDRLAKSAARPAHNHAAGETSPERDGPILASFVFGL
jgi:hypothetical protein